MTCKEQGFIRLMVSVRSISVTEIAELLLEKSNFWPERIYSGTDTKNKTTIYTVKVGKEDLI